jgi:Uma2 family endonuclease
MTAQPKHYITEEEYLAYERSSTTRHEYYAGVIYAMAGGTEPHNLIAGNAYASLHNQLRRKPCRVYQSDMRVKIARTSLQTYPDVVVICGQPQFADSVRDTVINPIALIEVLSPSTERYDRGMKFQHYRMIDSLRDYILIAQDQHHIEHYVRQGDDTWVLREATGTEAQIYIQSIECMLRLEDVYEKVELETEGMGIPRDISPEL